MTLYVRVAERLTLPTSVHGVAGSNPAGGEILPEPKRHFIAQSLSCSSFHRLEMTEILLKGCKTLTHPSNSMGNQWLKASSCRQQRLGRCTGWYKSLLGTPVILFGFVWLKCLWDAWWENQQHELCAQRRLRSAWASAQSDQSLPCRMKKAWALS